MKKIWEFILRLFAFIGMFTLMSAMLFVVMLLGGDGDFETIDNILLIIVLSLFFILSFTVCFFENFNSNERKSVRKHEDKEEICPKCKHSEATIFNIKYETYRCATCGTTWTN
jgi:Na+/melibiose symporter-like transporter